MLHVVALFVPLSSFWRPQMISALFRREALPLSQACVEVFVFHPYYNIRSEKGGDKREKSFGSDGRDYRNYMCGHRSFLCMLPQTRIISTRRHHSTTHNTKQKTYAFGSPARHALRLTHATRSPRFTIMRPHPPHEAQHSLPLLSPGYRTALLGNRLPRG